MYEDAHLESAYEDNASQVADFEESEDDYDDETLGSCGCTDYHMADCPTRDWQAAQYNPWEDDYA